MQGPIELRIIEKLQQFYSPQYLSVVNESHSHNVPVNSETHFKVFLVSSKFEGVTRVQRQRQVYQTLSQELSGPVHALSLRLITDAEWEAQGRQAPPDSPPCHGGSKK